MDCEAIVGPDSQGGATGTVIIPQEPQSVVQEAAVGPLTPIQPQPVATAGLSGANVRKRGYPSAQEVMNVIALKCFEPVDPSNSEELNGFIQYMEKVRKVIVVDTKSGSLIITVECSSLQVLDELWEDYCTGNINEVAQKFLVTEDVLTELGILEVTITTTVDEEEYRACREYFLNQSGRYERISYFYAQ